MLASLVLLVLASTVADASTEGKQLMEESTDDRYDLSERTFATPTTFKLMINASTINTSTVGKYCRIVLFGIGLAFFGATTSLAQKPFTGSWSGVVEAGTDLRVLFHIEQGEDGLTATMDVPAQNASGLPVSRVRVSGDSVTLSVNRIGGVYKGTLVDSDTKIEGTWSQKGQSFPLTLTPSEKTSSQGPPRPQHPEPPYPYSTEDITFQNKSVGITLAGTLTHPQGKGPYPAVVLVSGSGPQGRDSEVYNHKLFHVLADHLTRQGIAVLRYDERGIGESQGDFEGATSEDLAGDVAAAVRFLKGRPTIDTQKVGLLGMSEGGLIGPMVHTRFEPVDFLALMAAPSVSGGELLVEQAAQLLSARGASPSSVDSIRNEQQKIMEAIRTAPDSSAASHQVRSVLKQAGEKSDRLQSRVGKLTDPWFRYFVRYNPTSALRQLDVPVLALYGSQDVQVPPEQNAGPMRRALRKSPSDDTTVRVLQGLNHLFQPAETGLPNEYAKIDTTMSPSVLQTISEWIRKQSRP